MESVGQIGNYHLVRLLGTGGFAQVYLGEHIYLGRQDAIKTLLKLSEHEVEGFKREARIIATLEHPHIVRIHDFNVENGVPFLVMEYLPHGSLRQRHKRGERVPILAVVSYVNQVAEALQYAHDQRIIHRDVKPDNMLIGRNNEVILSDFGIAAISHNTSSRTMQQVAGTIPYMAPEQIQTRACPASDQYALAIIVYEWLTGERPFEGSYTEILGKHLMVPPPALREKIPTIAAGVEQVVLKALAKAPEDRYSSIQEFARALEQAAACCSRCGQQLLLPGRFCPACGVLREDAHAQDSTQVAATMLPPTIAVKEVLSVEQSLAATTDQPLPVGSNILWEQFLHQTLETATDQPLPDTMTLTSTQHFDQITSIAWSPDGKCIAAALEAAKSQTGQPFDHFIVVWELSTGKEAGLYPMGESDDFPLAIAWSPEGRYIAAGSKRTLKVLEARTGNILYGVSQASRISRYALGDSNGSAAWSPDGGYIASIGMSKGIRGVEVRDAQTGTLLMHFGSDFNHTPTTIRWSPDGKYIAFDSSSGKVAIYDSAGQQSCRTKYKGKLSTIIWSPEGKCHAIAYDTSKSHSNYAFHLIFSLFGSLWIGGWAIVIGGIFLAVVEFIIYGLIRNFVGPGYPSSDPIIPLPQPIQSTILNIISTQWWIQGIILFAISFVVSFIILLSAHKEISPTPEAEFVTTDVLAHEEVRRDTLPKSSKRLSGLSQDGNYIVYKQDDTSTGKLGIVACADITGTKRFTSLPADKIACTSVSPDGKRIAIASQKEEDRWFIQVCKLT